LSSRSNDIAFNVLPDDLPGQLISAQQAVHGIVTEPLAVIGEVGHREVALSRKKKLAIVDSIDAHVKNQSDTSNSRKNPRTVY
jgi:hypothetical protein